MASSIIHMCVANEINNVINKDRRKMLIGSVAPDIAKQIGMKKYQTHFQDEDKDYPDLERFLEKYKNNLNDDFVLGYYIHLYTDYYWFKYFISHFNDIDCIYTLDGNVVKCTEDEKREYIYNDYTNLNIKLIDEYLLSLDIFYLQIPEINDIIKEMPLDKLDILIEKVGIIIENSNQEKKIIFDIKEVKKFIEFSVSGILNNLKELGVI